MMFRFWRSEAWTHTANTAYWLFKVNGGKHKTPEDFHPFAKQSSHQGRKRKLNKAETTARLHAAFGIRLKESQP